MDFKQDISIEEKVGAIANWLQHGSLNLFGRPFAGKDTQCNRLASHFNAPPAISGGHILRSTKIPERVKLIMESGQLAPIEDYLKIVTPYLSQPDFEGRPLILSSLGRWHGEEQGILQGCADAGHPLKAAVLLDIPEEIVRERWQALHPDTRGVRADDDHAALDVRLQEFKNKTLDVIDFYRQKGMLIEVNGTASPDQVEAELLDKLYELAHKSAIMPV
jgi:adenylate kinase